MRKKLFFFFNSFVGERKGFHETNLELPVLLKYKLDFVKVSVHSVGYSQPS